MHRYRGCSLADVTRVYVVLRLRPSADRHGAIGWLNLY